MPGWYLGKRTKLETRIVFREMDETFERRQLDTCKTKKNQSSCLVMVVEESIWSVVWSSNGIHQSSLILWARCSRWRK